MKRILSIILAATLVVSLVPAVFAGDAEAETISYVIKEGSIKTTALDSEIIAPVETAEGDNYGKIKFTGGTYLAKTVLNSLKNSEGLFDKGDSSVSNSETSLVTYRTVQYHAYIDANKKHYPVRKPATSYSYLYGVGNATKGLEVDSETSEAKVYTISETIDLTKTAPFELFGKAANVSHAFLYKEGFRGSFNFGTSATPNLPADLHKYSYAVRIKIPETAKSGSYTVKLTNDLDEPSSESIYSGKYASATEVYITKVDPIVGFNAKWTYNGGGCSSFTSDSGSALSEKYYADTENKLTGFWVCANGSEKEFPDIRTFEAGAEYIVYFRIDPDTVAKINDGTYSSCVYSEKYYQNFHISTINLIPSEDAPVILKSANISYDNATKKVSVANAIMTDGTDADLTKATVTYSIESANGATISASGIITPGSADETASVYATITLDGTTITTEKLSVKLYKSIGTNLRYRLSTNFISTAMLDVITAADADANNDIRNSELLLVSWKDVYYTKTASGNTFIINKAAANATDLAPITNALTPDTAKYELPGRVPGDLVPKFIENGYIAQYILRKFTGEELTTNQIALGSKSRPHFALKIYVPQKGAYKLSLTNNITLSDISVHGGSNYVKNSASLGREAVTEVYFAKADFDLEQTSTGAGYIPADKEASILTDENKIGWYDSGILGEAQSYDKTLIASEAGEYYVIFNMCEESLEKNPNVYHRSYSNDVYQDFQMFSVSEISLTPVAEDADYSAAFDAVEKDYITSGSATVNAYTYADGQEELSLGNTVSLGGSFTATAPDKEGYDFLYWAKGLGDKKQVISYSKNLSYKPNEGANYVIAVYVKEGDEETRAEFYNANGSLIATVGADGKAPAYPSMAGFGKASGWQLYGTDETYGYDEEIADMAGSGKLILVAKYDETPATVIVNGEKYTYGETVTMPAIDSSRIFKGWKRNDELVSVDPDYTFKAWENATVEAVYADAAPAFSGKFMKIVIDSFNAGDETAVMAEFIGLEGAIEKGIKVGSKKIAMKGDGKQFSILADVAGEYIGYAILRDGNGFIEVTDGSEEVE